MSAPITTSIELPVQYPEPVSAARAVEDIPSYLPDLRRAAILDDWLGWAASLFGCAVLVVLAVLFWGVLPA